jgi:glutathione peroxidase
MRTLVAACSLVALAVGVSATFSKPQDSRPASPIHDLSMKRIDGSVQKLADYKGKVALLVNVASECGFTPQYEGLQKLQAKYAERGFTVLAFPSNDFGGQEPGSDADILVFCRDTYHVTFPLFSKVAVLGSDACPLYRYLQLESPSKAVVKWNFHKFLVDGDGNVIGSFGSKVPPEDPKVVAAIEAALSKGGTASKPSTAAESRPRTATRAATK